MATAFVRNGAFPKELTLPNAQVPQNRTGISPKSQLSLQHRAAIHGTGSYLPKRVLDNPELEQMVCTNNQWIVERTGIRERRIAAEDETTASMAVLAGTMACADAGIDPADLDLIILATITPDQPVPATACHVQHALKAKHAAAFDLNAACSGFLYASTVATGMIGAGLYDRVLVIGSETMSRVTDYTDRNTCVLFGDGAGAAVFAPRRDGTGVLYSKICADGEHAELLQIPAGGSKRPASAETVAERQHYLRVAGKQVFKFATNIFVRLVEETLAACELTFDDIALVIPHQVNERIIDAAMSRLGMPTEKCFVNIARYGNTSSASVPIGLDEARRQGRLNPGDIAILLAFGAA